MQRFLIFCIVLVVSGCSSISVRRDFDAATDFSTFETYAWQHADQPRTGNPRIDDDLLDQRIRDAIDQTLSGKGYVRGNREDADLLVTYHLQYRQRITGTSIGFGMGVGTYGNHGSMGYTTSISDYDEGHLTIDLISRDTMKSVWRGVGVRGTYAASSPEKITRIVNQAVGRILSDFPPHG